MKKIFLLILITFTGLVGHCLTLEGNLVYSVEKAREMTFDHAETQIPLSEFQSYLSDPDYKESKDYIKYEMKPHGREIEVFKKGNMKLAYAVRYDYQKDVTYFYSKVGGVLLFIDKDKIEKNQKSKYPIKIYRYNTEGKLISAGIHVSDNEGFLYNIKGKLITHRIGDYGYNEKGKKVWKAEEVKF